MELLKLQNGIIYGPVHSRRLGLSLGINLLPTGYKLCSFDCVYCHYGRTRVKTRTPNGMAFPTAAEVLTAVDGALRSTLAFDFLTFSGNGEPTLHPDFPEIAAGVRRLRDQLRPGVRLAILSNATMLHLPHVREALGLFDSPLMKLDAGDQMTLTVINRPADGVRLEQILAGMKALKSLQIQSVLIGGSLGNTSGDSYENWLTTLAESNPVRVQIYSTDRPVPEPGVERILPEQLLQIAADVRQRTGLEVEAYWR